MRGISAVGSGLAWMGIRLGLLAGLLVTVLCARLVWGPVEVPVPESALRALTARVTPGLTFEAAGAEIDLFGKNGLSGFKVRNVRVRDGAGRSVAMVPELGLSMAFSIPNGEKRGVDIRGVRIRGARLDILRDAEGGFDFAIDGVGGDDGRFEPGYLPRIELIDATIDYRDPTRGVGVVFHAARAVLGPDETLMVVGHAEAGNTVRMQFEAMVSRLPGGTTRIEADLNAVHPPSLARLDPLLARLEAIDAVIGGTVRATLAPDASLIDLTAHLDAPEGGDIVLETGSRHFERARLDVAHGPEGTRFDLSDVRIEDSGFSLIGAAMVQRQESDNWAIAASAPALRYVGNEGALETGRIEINAETNGDIVRIMAAEISAPTVKLPEGGELNAASMVMSGDVGNGDVRLDTLVLQDIEGVSGDTVFALDRLMTALDATDEAVMFDAASLSGFTLRKEGLVAEANQADANIAVTLPTGSIAFDISVLRELEMALPKGRKVTVPRLALSGNLDTKADAVTVTRLRAPGMTIDLPGVYQRPAKITDLKIALDATPRSVDLLRLSGRLNGLAVTGKGAVKRVGQSMRGNITLDADSLDLATIESVWPRAVAAGGRRWVMRNVLKGRIDKATLEARVDTSSGSDDSLALNVDFAEATVTAIPGMPPLRNARGRASVSLDRLDVSLHEGSVAAPGHDSVRLSRSRFSIPDLAAPVPQGDIELSLTGSAGSILRYLDEKPLALVSRTGFDIAEAKGRATGEVMLKLPLRSDIRLKDIDFRAKATVHDFALREPHTDARITGDTLRVGVTPDEMTFRSDARINGLSARVISEQRFAPPPPGEPEGQLTLQSYLTHEDFALHAGIDVREYFDGVAALDATVDLYPGGGTRFVANADLSAATLRLASLGWTKTAGVPVTMDISGFRNRDGAGEIENIEVRGTGIAVKGRAGFDPDGVVPRADFDQIALADLLDTGIRYRRDGVDNMRRIEVTGDYLDLQRPFADALAADGERPTDGRSAPTGTVTEVLARIGTVKLRDALDITDMAGRFRMVGERFERVDVAGNVNNAAASRLQVQRNGENLALRLTAPNAGAFLDAASVFEGATGGTLRLDARMAEGARHISGVASADGIVIRDSHTMRRILAGGAVSSLARRMLSDGLSFTRVKLPFSGVGGRWAIADGVAWGDELGLTLDGSYDIARKGIDLRGTVSPAYAINGALGAVPLVGELLTGGEGEGVFGVTFSVGGTTDHPAVRVNPLSAIAPGFLRKIVTNVMEARPVQEAEIDRLPPTAGPGR